MKGFKKALTILVIVLGPGVIIYILATNLSNKFVELPYLGEWTYKYGPDSSIVDSTAYVVPKFELTSFDGTIINRDSIEDKFIILSTLQDECPLLEECGMSLYLFDQLILQELEQNQKNYSNVRVLSILTDMNGNPVEEGPSERFKEEMEEYDQNIWWATYGDPTPLFSFEYYGKDFMEHESVASEGEIGDKAFVNSLVLIDKEGHIRGVTGAKKDSDIRNFFDLLKVLKKAEFDENWEKEHS